MYEVSRSDAGLSGSPPPSRVPSRDQRYYTDSASSSPPTPLSPVRIGEPQSPLTPTAQIAMHSPEPRTPLSPVRIGEPQSPLTPTAQIAMHSPEGQGSPMYKHVMPSGPYKFQQDMDVDDRKEDLVDMLLTAANIEKQHTLLGRGQESSVYKGTYDTKECAWKLIVVKSGKLERSGRAMYVFDVVPKVMKYYSLNLQGLSSTIMPTIYNPERLKLENINRSHHPFYGCMHAVELLSDIIDKAGASESLLTKYSSPTFDVPESGMFANMFCGNAENAETCKDRFADFTLTAENRLERDYVDQNILIQSDLWSLMQKNSGKWCNKFNRDQVKQLFRSIWRPGLDEYDPAVHVFIFDLHTQNLMVRITDKKYELVLSDYVIPLEVVPDSDYYKNGTITPEGMDEIRPAVTRHRVSRILFILVLYGIISPNDADNILEYFKDDSDLAFPTNTPLFSPEIMY